MNSSYDVVVIGGGPAGLAAAISAEANGAKVLLIEREARLGGILKQCIHDGFGVIRFGKKMAGSEYAQYFIDEIHKTKATVKLLCFVTDIKKGKDLFTLSLVSREGAETVSAKAIVLATGCRERTARQVSIHGEHGSGILTAGTAQYFTNILGKMPCKECVILGSGDIGLIMARRLTLEGARVIGVYEAKPTPSGLARNISQCLNDFNIPLHLSKTVTRTFGADRITAVEICSVDECMRPILSTAEIVQCDSLILSVGLIPENELAQGLGVALDTKTKGAFAAQDYMTDISGVFVCGNALHVNDLVDYVTQSGCDAGRAAARYTKKSRLTAEIAANEKLLYIVPQRLDLKGELNAVTIYFRSKEDMAKASLQLTCNGECIFEKKYTNLRPPEMQQIIVDLSKLSLDKCENADKIQLKIKLCEVN